MVDRSSPSAATYLIKRHSSREMLNVEVGQKIMGGGRAFEFTALMAASALSIHTFNVLPLSPKAAPPPESGSIHSTTAGWPGRWNLVRSFQSRTGKQAFSPEQDSFAILGQWRP